MFEITFTSITVRKLFKKIKRKLSSTQVVSLLPLNFCAVQTITWSFLLLDIRKKICHKRVECCEGNVTAGFNWEKKQTKHLAMNQWTNSVPEHFNSPPKNILLPPFPSTITSTFLFHTLTCMRLKSPTSTTSISMDGSQSIRFVGYIVRQGANGWYFEFVVVRAALSSLCTCFYYDDEKF